MMRPKLTYSNVVATLALFIALGGASYAALKLPKNSVGRKQIKRSAINSAKVQNGSLMADDFNADQLPVGPTGREGPPGPKGDPGRDGTKNVVVRYGPNSKLLNGDLGLSNAPCDTSETATGGGFQFVGELPTSSSFIISQDRPSILEEGFPVPPADGTQGTGWVVSMENKTGSTLTFRSYAMCASP
jgi:hypothetical protein